MAGRIAFMAPLCDEYGSNLKDLVSGNVLTYTSAPTFHTSGGSVYEEYTETTVGNKLVMALSDDIRINHADTSFSIEAWVSVTAPMSSDSRYIFRLSALINPEYTANAVLGLNPSVGFYAALGTGPADMSINTGGALIPPLNTWVHVAMSFDKPSMTLRLFVAGNLVSTAPVPSLGAIAGQPAIYIGYDPANNTRSFIGGIQDVRLTIDDTRYTKNFTPPTRLTKPLSGTVFRQDGGLPKPYVLARNSNTLKTNRFEVGDAGEWGFLGIKTTSYDISYMADGLKPEIHGPYTV